MDNTVMEKNRYDNKCTFRVLLVAFAMVLAGVQLSFAENKIKDEFNPIQTGVTSLGIAPDARGASMRPLTLMSTPSSGIRRNMLSLIHRPVCR